jgi:hypothetical protein
MIKWTWLLISNFQYCNLSLPNVQPPMKPLKPKLKPISKIVDVICHGGCHLETLVGFEKKITMFTTRFIIILD